MRICIYAFSTTALFFRALIDRCQAEGDTFEWSVVFPQGNFRDTMADVIPVDRTCYLYEDFRRHYGAIDDATIQRGLEADEGLVVALMKDKAGYRFLEKDEQLRRAAATHAVYEEFLRRIKPDVVLFPDVEAVNGFILVNLCKSLGIEVFYTVAQRFLRQSFFARDTYETLPRWFGPHTDQDLQAARHVIKCFRERTDPRSDAEQRFPMPPIAPLFRRVIVNGWNRWRYERLHVSEETIVVRIRRNMRHLADGVRRLRFNLVQSRFFDRVALEQLPARYVFYALHMTPESSINGLEPYYVDQFRVVDALLLNLPKGMRLVVKEHPVMRGFRSNAFYRELRRRPGLILLHPLVDSRALVERASLIATVSGTIGLESYLMGKPCVLFGRAFFSHLCLRAPALSELRAALDRLVESYRPATEAEKEIEIARLLHVAAEFEISNPYHFPETMAPHRIRAARDLLKRYLAKLPGAARPAA